ncbi:hypothetical protein C7S18_16590 [Ahniella affigens]|uniref:Protein kinase domain-containing protein n=1 Tax=Ahniella affigens TaxID=2021234 RepID=A0A2P1PV25_9GAMM|nr:serine/threonine-protein kinase [Ahniella affigens]AVP98706.1 hypothetical protein C7S18_16590 [Ahniella affigens]
MTPGDLPQSLSDWFAFLQPLPQSARAAALVTAPEAMRDRLLALLAADAAADSRLDAALALPIDADLLEPERMAQIGPWRILGELGRGGMGTVWLGERALDGTTQRGAIKLMRGRAGAEDRARFRRERHILAMLDHPDIARLIDGGEGPEGQPFLVVEFVRGDTLAARVKQAPPDRDTAIAWVTRIAAAVQHAHQHLVIHRDLKPANVMITPEGGIKLLDFGVAKLLDPGTGDDDASTRVFTPGYASPEQLAGRAVGTASDVFSLGRILSELLGLANLPRDLRAIRDKACAESVTERYPTMAALHADLRAWQHGLPVQATAPSWWYRGQKLVARHPIVSVAAAMGLSLILFLGWRWYAAGVRAEQARIVAEQARAETEMQLQRSQQVIGFYAQMFAGVAPEFAAGQKLAPAALLERAERLLRAAPPADPVLRAELSASLGTLYQRLGDGENAVRLLQAGLTDHPPPNAAAELDRADREQSLAYMLADLDRRDEALTFARAAQARRLRVAPQNTELQLESELVFVNLFLGQRQIDTAKAAMDRAETWSQQIELTPATKLDLLQARSALWIEQQQFQLAADAAVQSLELLAQNADLDQSRRVELNRSLARARQGLGDLRGAETAFAAAIAAQTTLVGDRGTRAFGLHNDHAILLATLGQFADAKAAYEHAAVLFAESGGPEPLLNPRHLNNLCDAETGSGDYALAVTHCRAALARLIAEQRPESDSERLLVESNLARARAYAGEPRPALAELALIRARAVAAQGDGSFVAWLQAFRAVRISLLAHDTRAADAWAQLTETGMRQLFPTPHPWRVRSLRILARWQLECGSYSEAKRYLEKGEREAESVLPPGHPVRAQLALDRAVIAVAESDLKTARSALAQALPALQQCCTASELDRSEAERLQTRLAGH